MVKEVEFYEACKNGDAEKVKKLLKEKKLDVNKLHNGETALHAACGESKEEIVKLLLADMRVDKKKANSKAEVPFDVIRDKEDKTSIVQLFLTQVLRENIDIVRSKEKAGPKRSLEQMKAIFSILGSKAKVVTRSMNDMVGMTSSLEDYLIYNEDSGDHLTPALLQARCEAENTYSNYHFFTLLKQAAEDCKGEITKGFSFGDLGAGMPFRQARHKEGLSRCEKIIQKIEESIAIPATGFLSISGSGYEVVKLEKPSIVDAEYVTLPEQSTLGSNNYIAGLDEIIQKEGLYRVKEIKDALQASCEGGGLLLGSEASLNTHLIRLYDNNYYLFGDTKEVAATLDDKQKITRLISRCEEIEKGLEKVFEQGVKPNSKK